MVEARADDAPHRVRREFIARRESGGARFGFARFGSREKQGSESSAAEASGRIGRDSSGGKAEASGERESRTSRLPTPDPTKPQTLGRDSPK